MATRADTDTLAEAMVSVRRAAAIRDLPDSTRRVLGKTGTLLEVLCGERRLSVAEAEKVGAA
jgi:hypothetical protein